MQVPVESRIPSTDSVVLIDAATTFCLLSSKNKFRVGLGGAVRELYRLLRISWLLSHTVKSRSTHSGIFEKVQPIGSEEVIQPN